MDHRRRYNGGGAPAPQEIVWGGEDAKKVEEEWLVLDAGHFFPDLTVSNWRTTP